MQLAMPDTAVWVATPTAELTDQQLTEYARILDVREQARAARLQRSEDRQTYVYAHWLKRQVLSSCTGISPEALCFGVEGKGKPVLSDQAGLFFNLSHSGSLIALGVSRRGRVGIDIEALAQRPRDWLGIASSFFSTEEHDWLAGMAPGSGMAYHFAQLWTLKEALLKGLGVGIAGHLRQVSFALENKEVRFTGSLPVDGWQVALGEWRGTALLSCVVESSLPCEPIPVFLADGGACPTFDWIARGILAAGA